jgi:aryl-alcohol dehydrogenase-like predicted oxidoreductase
MQTFSFGGHRLAVVFKGNWQLSGGHGAIAREQAIDDLFTYAAHGVNVFDAADIYTGVEEILGQFMKAYTRRFGRIATERLRVHTKFVPDLSALPDLTRRDVRAVVERSLRRLGLDRLGLVQFHWWDFAAGDFVAAAHYLEELRREGLIETIGLTNFDCAHTQLLLDAGVSVRSNQVQFSLVDPRPLNGMLDFAQRNGIAIFCYGTLAGGLLGHALPDTANRSHVKYQLIIDEVGRAHYEAILSRLNLMADHYQTTVANIATRFVLQTAGVQSVILGPRNASHVDELDQLSQLELSGSDYQLLRDLVGEAGTSVKGDIYSYERDRAGGHGRIMKYDLNGMR